MRRLGLFLLLVGVALVVGQQNAPPQLPQLWAQQDGQMPNYGGGGSGGSSGGGGGYAPPYGNFYQQQPQPSAPAYNPFQSAAQSASQWANGAAGDFKQGASSMAQNLRNAGETVRRRDARISLIFLANIFSISNAPRNLMDNVSLSARALAVCWRAASEFSARQSGFVDVRQRDSSRPRQAQRNAGANLGKIQAARQCGA